VLDQGLVLDQVKVLLAEVVQVLVLVQETQWVLVLVCISLPATCNPHYTKIGHDLAGTLHKMEIRDRNTLRLLFHPLALA
jgi:hypothetical protein